MGHTVTNIIKRAEEIARAPRRRHWKRFLSGFTLDPDRLPRPVPEPGGRDFMICGSPRSGTTLLSAALFQPPNCITVMEPWDGMRMPPAELFSSLRLEIATAGKLRRGKLDLGALEADGSVRWWKEGTASPRLSLSDDYLLGVKWPAFWQYLDLLPQTKFVVCVRDPVETIGSYKRNGGSITKGLDYDIAFNRSVNESLQARTNDFTLRRVLLHNSINERILPHLTRPNVCTVRYERWFTEPEALLRQLGAFLGTDLGATRVSIRASESQPELTDEELRKIRKHCSTAELLGYRLP